jgi:hypothetical protein
MCKNSVPTLQRKKVRNHYKTNRLKLHKEMAKVKVKVPLEQTMNAQGGVEV